MTAITPPVITITPNPVRHGDKVTVKIDAQAQSEVDVQAMLKSGLTGNTIPLAGSFMVDEAITYTLTSTPSLPWQQDPTDPSVFTVVVP